VEIQHLLIMDRTPGRIKGDNCTAADLQRTSEYTTTMKLLLMLAGKLTAKVKAFQNYFEWKRKGQDTF